MSATAVNAATVRYAVSSVDDPEYPGISIDDLGILVDVRVEPATGRVEVDLVPTRLGCPALALIRHDVEAAAAAVAGVETVEVRFRHDVPWTPERISERARRMLATQLTIAVRERDGTVRCPVCGGTELESMTEVGPAPCRSVARCRGCRNPVEVVRP